MEIVLSFLVIFVILQILGIPIINQLYLALWVIFIGSVVCAIFFIISFIILLCSKRAAVEFIELTYEIFPKMLVANYKYNDSRIFNIFPTDHCLSTLYKKETKNLRVVRLFGKNFVIDGFTIATILLGLPVFTLISAFMYMVLL